jgi:hypothetical protein
MESPMTKIKDILTLDLEEDIKNVIDLEDRSELEIQQEIESYIVTEGIGRHLYNFTTQFTSNIKETGVWLSGFYGSGKSYFGKMLGYVIDNPTINGTPARERFIPRISGVSDESLIKNSILNLDSIESRVVFLDVAKQNTDKGLAFTLFQNFLKTLGFRDDIYGYMEFELFIEGKLDDFKAKAKEVEGAEWDEIKTSNRQVAKAMRKVYLEMGYSEADYDDTKNVYSSSINNFSASKFKEALDQYLKVRADETLVFIFDEASEAISQKKFTLLDLEGVSETLSSISNKVWTIAIAQEKLDDVINNANVNRSQLTKVTDRFKTKIHLESTEVDVIIRSRLLGKDEGAIKKLSDYYKKNEGLVADATNLKSSFPTKTKEAEEFATYYPFHRYQFDILQKFLFSSNALVATQVAARGMIITTFDVLRKQMRDKELFDFTTGHSICSEAQTAPPVALVNKYDTARKILRESESSIDGEKLLKTIHLLSDSEVVSPTIENITKTYLSKIDTYYEIKPEIEKALPLLLEAKVLLLSSNNYKITSDLEGKLLDEMKDFDVELFKKKRTLILYLKDYKTFTPIATYVMDSDNFKFGVYSDQEDELVTSPGKDLRITVYSLFNVGENRSEFIENLKMETKDEKGLITMVPESKDFAQIDRLFGEVIRYTYMEEKYSNETDPDKRQIIRDFAIIREEKEKELRMKVESAYRHSSLIFLFDEHLLNPDTFKAATGEIQRKLIKNRYTKRLATSLSEGLVPKIFGSRKEGLHRLFSGDDFKFFDGHGNFTGEHLKVVEEITAKINSRYVDGRTLESELSGAPWGYAFGTIVSTLASLFRSGRLSVKHNGETCFSHEQPGVQDAFTNATKFKSASFKSITASISAAQKNKAVQLLMDLEVESHTGRKVDWNINDFDLADGIRHLADHFIGALTTLNDTVDGFEALFPGVADQKKTLSGFVGKVTEGNYVEKVENLLTNADPFSEAIQTILKAQKFIKKNFSKARDFKRFIEEVVSELKKADRTDDTIGEAREEFERLYKQDMVKNYAGLQQQVQIVKDNYYKLAKNAAAGMSHEYKLIGGKADAALRKLKKCPPEPNARNQAALDALKRYCSERVVEEPSLEYSISCRDCGYSLSDILNYTALAPSKANELLILESGFITEAPKSDRVEEPAPKKPRKVSLRIAKKIMTVQEYKTLLTEQLSLLASSKPDDEIEVEIDQ